MAGAPRVYDSSLTTDAPVFAPPATPSRSPFKDLYATHRRSPTKQLRAGAKAQLNREEYDRIVGSEISTAAEKELASRVVRAADRLKEWCREIEQWGWTGTFAKQRDGSLFERQDLNASLAPEVVEEYDARLDVIDQKLEELEVDDLKEQILGIHLGRSRPSSSYSTASTANLVLYDDFQLFVTESLLHTLPYHMKLKHYLKAWHIRLSVFREIPTFLDGLTFLHEILLEAWQGLKRSSTPKMNEKEIDDLEAQLETAQETLKSKVLQLGQQLDRMLDTLEGQDDCLPDAWIDKYEDNEKDYAEWSYQADRKLFQLRHMEKQPISVLANRRPIEAQEATEEQHLQNKKLELQAEEHHAKAWSAAVAGVELAYMSSQTESSQLDKRTDSSNPTETPISPPSTIADLSFADVRASTPPNDIGRTLNETRTGLATERNTEEFPQINGAEQIAHEAEALEDEEPVIVEAVHRPVEAVLRRASVASIESFTRDQVRSVDVPSRRSSVASFSSIKRPASRNFDPTSTPSPNETRKTSRTTSPLATDPTAAWPDIRPVQDDGRPRTPPPSVPTIRRNSTSSIATSATRESEEELEPGEESPSVRASKKPPLNQAMKKRRGEGPRNIFSDQDLAALDTSLPTIPASPTKVKSPVSPSIALDEQIANILDHIPTARIKLKSSSTPGAPDVKAKRTRERKSSTASNVSNTSEVPSSRPAIRNRAVTPNLSTRPGITLAPADDQVPRRGANEPEIKVYHLMSGNDKPLKLFIRRVGENGERVMVRVGGGWADLAEYLKTYAEHHGHRTVSEGKVEVLGLGNDRVVTPTPGSNGRSSALGFRSDSRAESRLGMRSDSRQGTRPGDSRRSSLISPVTATSIGFPSTIAGAESTDSPLQTGTPRLESETATPTSAQSLMGPAAIRKNSEISSEKKEWVDSVVEQAKKVGRKVEFGDLGKKGGTRRVFVRGGRVVSNGNAPEEKE